MNYTFCELLEYGQYKILTKYEVHISVT